MPTRPYAKVEDHEPLDQVGGTDELTAALQGGGVEVLQNDVATVPFGEGDGADPLHVVGLGAARPGLDDADQALGEIPEDAPRLVLMHNPTSFPELPAHAAPLALAGHTHCGQIALPGSPHWSYLRLTAEEALVADGFAPADYGAEGNELFVSCGIDFSLVPVRINAASPQLVLVELRPGDA